MKGKTPHGCCASDKAWLSGKLLVPVGPAYKMKSLGSSWEGNGRDGMQLSQMLQFTECWRLW